MERVLSAKGLVLCFQCSLRARVICYSRLKTTSFAFFTLFFCFFLGVFTEKICVVTAIMLFMDDKLDEEDVSMIFDELEVQN